HRDADVVNGDPSPRNPIRPRIGIFGSAYLRITAAIFVKRITPFGEGGKTKGDLVSKRYVDRCLGQALIVVAELEAAVSFPLTQLGRVGDDVDGAPQGVAAAQGALWTQVDFDALDVVKHRAEATRAGDVHAIDVGRRTGVALLGIIVASDTAHVHFDVTFGRAYLHVRSGGGQLANRGDATTIEVFARNRLHGRGHLLNVFASPIRRDDDDACFTLIYRSSFGES